MKTIRFKGLAALSGLGFLLAAVPTQAATFTESDDAGESLQTAAAVTSAQSMSLESISGSLSGDADLFKIFLTGGQTFSATTTSSETADIPVNQAAGIPIDVVIDPKIFLFDELGNGVYANDDLFGSVQSTLLSGPGGFSPTASGIYFLGISGTGLEAVSANGQIFPSEPFDQIAGPTGAGGGSPLTGFVGDRTASFGKYTLSLTGAQTIAAAPPTDPAASVPEPAMTLGLLMVGGLIISQAKQSNRNQIS
ncbi:hypothetical protein [Leptolyngbya sp. BC1307]|uniref:hypothetical protein n=1 Tax=Leptolyngbya sp. BC1307 TaxID=2029589 RepID=UPI000EFC3917|nr:hypothetical protein [Leptolyngbya sp. BC1307]